MLPFCAPLEQRLDAKTSQSPSLATTIVKRSCTSMAHRSSLLTESGPGGSHYASRRDLPCACGGSDGVGHLSGGHRVFFGGPRPPYGAMAQRTVVPRALIFPVPENVDDETAAALPNPGVSAWLSLAYREKLVRGENVLILGATWDAARSENPPVQLL